MSLRGADKRKAPFSVSENGELVHWARSETFEPDEKAVLPQFDAYKARKVEGHKNNIKDAVYKNRRYKKNM